MKNNPQQACQSCCEFIEEVKKLKHEAQDAKRLPTLSEALAVEIKAFTLPAVAAAARHDPCDQIPDRQMAAANDPTLTLQF